MPLSMRGLPGFKGMIRPYGGAVPYTLAVILIRQQNSLSKTNYIEGKKFKIPEMETKLLLFPIILNFSHD